MNIRIICSLFVFTIAFSAKPGFIVGFGAGLHSGEYSQELFFDSEYYSTDILSEGLATDFKIGFALNNALEVYYTSKVAWFSMDNALGETSNMINGLAAFGGSIFLNPYKPTIFISGGVGISTWTVWDDPDYSPWTGTGYYVGIGTEFSKNLRIEANLISGKPETSEYDYYFNDFLEIFMEAAVMKVSFNYMLY